MIKSMPFSLKQSGNCKKCGAYLGVITMMGTSKILDCTCGEKYDINFDKHYTNNSDSERS